MNSKLKRIEDPGLIATVQQLVCLACFKRPCHAHHVKTRGAGGHDVPENLMPLCAEHHRMIHDKGTSHMATVFPSVRHWLLLAGWCCDGGRWKREEVPQAQLEN